MKLVKGFFALITIMVVMSMAGTPWAGDMEQIDINKASAKELTQFQKAGPSIAQRIVDYRQEKGAFKNPEDITKVRGIGSKFFELNKDRIVAGQSKETPAEIKKAVQIKKKAVEIKKEAVEARQEAVEIKKEAAEIKKDATEVKDKTSEIKLGKIDINNASAEKLTQLHRIGPAIAKKIVEYRQSNGPFRTPGDIVKVSGIGPKTFELNKDRIVTGQIEAITSSVKKVSEIKTVSEVSKISEVKTVSETEGESKAEKISAEKQIEEKTG